MINTGHSEIVHIMTKSSWSTFLSHRPTRHNEHTHRDTHNTWHAYTAHKEGTMHAVRSLRGMSQLKHVFFACLMHLKLGFFLRDSAARGLGSRDTVGCNFGRSRGTTN